MGGVAESDAADRTAGPTPAELAEAIRAGLEARLGLRGDLGLATAPAAATTTNNSRFLAFLRRFYMPVVRALQAMVLEPFAPYHTQTTQSLQQLCHLTEALRRTGDARPEAGPDADGRSFHDAFVATRLPPPPAAVLALACADPLLPATLARLGYRVVGATEVDALAPESFDVLLRLDPRGAGGPDGTACAQEERVLRPGGLLILSFPASEAASRDADRATNTPSGFVCVEKTFAVRRGATWALEAEASAAAVALVVARKG